MIPLSVPNLSGNEWKYVKECLDTNWVSSVGSFVTRFEEAIASYTGSKHAIATSNGTAALHISLMLAGVRSGDYVIVPNITFIAPVNTIKYAHAEPILVDVDASTWQMDLNLLQEFLEEQTITDGDGCKLKKDGRRIAAVMPVHVLGNMVNMNLLKAIAVRYKLVIIEDATEALGSRFEGMHAGTFGTFGCLSFNGNKIMTTGGGGMIITNDSALAKHAKHLTTQAKSDEFEYLHDEVGYNYRLVNILAAMGLAQTEQLAGFVKRKKEIREFYVERLGRVKELDFQKEEKDVKPNNWLFTIKAQRQGQLMKHLIAKGIQVRPLWVPMNRIVMFEQCVYVTRNNVSDMLYASCVSLPCSTGITDQELQTVSDELRGFYGIEP